MRLAEVNTDAETTLASQFQIRSIPTLALFRSGREVARQAGALSKADIVRWARQHA
jgi:thioredoxin 2